MLSGWKNREGKFSFKDTGIIEVDEVTAIKGIPPIAWEYKLGNRSALEWILDQYKEKKPSAPTDGTVLRTLNVL